MRLFTPAVLLLLLPLQAPAAPIQEPTFEDLKLDAPLTARGAGAAIPKAFAAIMQAFGMAASQHRPKHHDKDVVIPLSTGMRFGSGPGK